MAVFDLARNQNRSTTKEPGSNPKINGRLFEILLQFEGLHKGDRTSDIRTVVKKMSSL